MVGLLIFYIAILAYEHQPGLIQSRIEELWIKIDDTQKRSLAGHHAILKIAASVIRLALDRIMGKRKFSLQSAVASSCLALSSAGLVLLVAVEWYPSPGSTGAAFDFATYFIVYLIFALIPIFIKNDIYLNGILFLDRESIIAIWICGIFVFVIYQVIWPILSVMPLFLKTYPKETLTTLAVGGLSIAIGLMVFILEIAALRKSLEFVEGSKSIVKSGLVLIGNLWPLLLIYLFGKSFFLLMESAPQKPEEILHQWAGVAGMAMGVVVALTIILNVIFLVTSTVFCAISLTVLIHRLFWPVIERVTYAIHQHNVLKRKKVLIALGTLFLFFAFGQIEWIAKIIKVIGEIAG